MPIDASIISRINVPGSAEDLQRQGAALELQKQRQEQQDTMRVRQILSSYPDLEQALPHVYRVNPLLGAKLEETVSAGKTRALQYQSMKLKHQQDEAEFIGQLFGGITDQSSLDEARYSAQQVGYDVSKFPTAWNAQAEAFAKSAANHALSVKDKAELDYKRSQEASRVAAEKNAEARTAETERKNRETAEATARREDRMADLTAAQIANMATDNAEKAARDAQLARHENETAGIARQRERREQSIYDQTYGAGGVNPDGTAKAPVVSNTAKMIAEYRMPPPSPRAVASGVGKALMEQVATANPEYDAKEYPKRSQIMKDYSPGGKIGLQLGSLNTAIEHMGLLDDYAKALKNGSFTPGNALYNKVRDIFGSKAVNNYEFARDVMSGELATAMKRSGATDKEIEKVTDRLGGSRSPEALAGAIREVGIPMIAGKARVLDEQFHSPQAMGEKDPYSVYTPGAKAVVDRLGSAAAAPAKAAVKISVTAPDGVVHGFDTQAQADAFKKLVADELKKQAGNK